MTNSYYHRNKENLHKKDVKDNKILLEKKKTKSTNMLVSNIEIFLKKKKNRSVIMVVNNIRIFRMRMSIKKFSRMQEKKKI